MKERPILFSVEMVRAVRLGLKVQTRRIVKPQPGQSVHHAYGRPDGGFTWCLETGHGVSERFACPYGTVGDRLWVREPFRIEQRGTYSTGAKHDVYLYRADSRIRPQFDPLRWKPSIHMPRAASRLTLAVVGVRVERLQSISEGDAMAEGVTHVGDRWEVPDIVATPLGAADAYMSLWNWIHGRNAWDRNPWVWVVEFRVADWRQ